MKQAVLKGGSLFDGSGGFPLSGALCGIEFVWASEIEPFPVKVTSARFPNMKHLGDVTKISGAYIEPVDVLTFGSPCTRLSVAGKHDGFDIEFSCHGDQKINKPHFQLKIRATDKFMYLYEMDCPVCGKHLVETNESALFFHATRIITEMRNATNGIYPRFAVWENVPGAFSSNNGDDFREVLSELSKIADPDVSIPRPDMGWKSAGAIMGRNSSLAWRVLDAQFWGVPQRRNRIFLVADFTGKCAPKILFERKSLPRYSPQSGEEGEAVTGTVADRIGTASENILYSFGGV